MSATAGAWRPQGGAVTYELASWGVRAAALLLDLLVVFALCFVLGIVAYTAEGGDREETRKLAELLVYTVVIPFTFVYGPLTMMRRGERNGQTFGKQAMKIRVVREGGEEVTFGSGLLREGLGRWLLVFATGLVYALVDSLWAVWDSGRQCVHDKVAKTRVVRVAPDGARRDPFAAPAQTTWTAAHEPAHEPAERDDRPVRGDWLPPRSGA